MGWERAVLRLHHVTIAAAIACNSYMCIYIHIQIVVMNVVWFCLEDFGSAFLWNTRRDMT